MINKGRAGSGSGRVRQRQQLIADVKRLTPGGEKGDPGSPGVPGGVTSYNARVGVVVSVLGDIVAHAATHANGGTDELNVGGLSGQLADGQTALAHSASHENAGSDEISIAGLSGLAADPQTPLAHSHLIADLPADVVVDADLAPYATDADLAAHVAAADPHVGYQQESEKGAVNGYASLDGAAKIPSSQLPAIAITDTFVVATQAAMLALTAETGDVAVRTDLSQTFILDGPDPSVLGDWTLLLTPTDTVLSVNGETGAVSLVAGDIPYSGAPGLAATDVEGALDELDSEKATPAQIAADIATHVALSDPHVQYQKESEKGAASGYASLDAGTKVPAAQIPAEYITDVELATELANYADTSHAATHAQGGSDALKLDDLATPDDNTDLNASLTRHGLLLKLLGGAALFLREDGTWAAPPGGAAADPTYSPGSFTVVTETQRFGPHRLKMTGAQRITIEGTGRLSCLE